MNYMVDVVLGWVGHSRSSVLMEIYLRVHYDAIIIFIVYTDKSISDSQK